MCFRYRIFYCFNTSKALPVKKPAAFYLPLNLAPLCKSNKRRKAPKTSCIHAMGCGLIYRLQGGAIMQSFHRTVFLSSSVMAAALFLFTGYARAADAPACKPLRLINTIKM